MISRLTAALASGRTLAGRSIRIQMHNNALGYAWTLIIPVLYAVCYIFIKQELAAPADGSQATGGWDVVRAFGGITLFQSWIQMVQEMSDLIRRNRGMLRGLNVGPAPFVLAIMLEGLVGFVIRAILIFVALPLLGLSWPSLSGIGLFLLCLAILHLSASGIGLVLAPWSALYGDVRKALQSINLPLVLISPIFYPAIDNTTSLLFWINVINPIASPLAVLHGTLQDSINFQYLVPMVIWGGLSVLIVTWSLIQLRRQIPILLERLGN